MVMLTVVVGVLLVVVVMILVVVGVVGGVLHLSTTTRLPKTRLKTRWACTRVHTCPLLGSNSPPRQGRIVHSSPANTKEHRDTRAIRDTRATDAVLAAQFLDVS